MMENSIPAGMNHPLNRIRLGGKHGALSSPGVILFVEIAVLAALNARYPILVVFVPMNCGGQSLVESHLRLPASFTSQFFVSQGVAAIVSGPIRDMGNQAFRTSCSLPESA
jgi:hypothetical protein